MSFLNRLRWNRLSLLFAVATSLVHAEIDWSKPFDKLDLGLPETVQIHGFASQAYLHTSANNFFGYTQNMGSVDFTEMGINGSWRPISNLQTSMQVVYRRAGRTDDNAVRIDFGFLDYTLLSTSAQSLGLRFGRVVNPYGLYNDTRDMPFTRPSILLPQSIYFDIARNTALSGDGIQVYGEQRTDYGDFLLQFNGGYARADDPSWKPVLNARTVYGELSWTGRLMYEWRSGLVRLGVSAANQNLGFQPAYPKFTGPGPGSFRFSPVLFSAQINQETWTLTGEYAIRGFDLRQGLFAYSPIGESYYVQGTYRLLDTLEGFVRYDSLSQDRDDPNGERAAAATGKPAYDYFAKDLATGIRWDVTPWFMLRGEYHYIEGTGWTSPLENEGATSKYWNMFAISASIRF